MTALSFDQLLPEMLELGASDIHLRPNLPPMVRIHGDLRPMGSHGAVSPDELKTLMETLLIKPERRDQFLGSQKSADFSHAIEGLGRFRVNYFEERTGWGCVLRQIPTEIPRLDRLNAPAKMLNFIDLPRGLILVTGPTGSGKSTTLASLLDLINRKRSDHILTVEDPIEFVHENRRCIVTQREVGEDTPSFAQALRDGLRQDPDVILVGEMRDLETIRTAITAAETGHLVMATLHTSSAPDTINRIIGVFPEMEQAQIRMQLASSLRAIVCQTLLPTSDGSGRISAHEVLISNTAVRAAIREDKMATVRTVLQTKGAEGMQTLDKALVDLVMKGTITETTGKERAHDITEFEQLLRSAQQGGRIDIPPKATRTDIDPFYEGSSPMMAAHTQAGARNRPPMPGPTAGPAVQRPTGRPTSQQRPPMPSTAVLGAPSPTPQQRPPMPPMPAALTRDDDDEDLRPPVFGQPSNGGGR